ncbi:MAG: hypothetical protein AABZ36_00160, partial [Nitrospirota bacterium]
MKNTLRRRWFLLILITFLGFTVVADMGATEGAGKDAFLKKVSGLQIPFIENQGQIKDKSVRFYANTFAGTVFVTDKGEIVYSLIKTDDPPNNRRASRAPSKQPAGKQNPEHRQMQDTGYKMQDVAAGFSLRNSELSTLNSNTKAIAIKETLEYPNQSAEHRAQNPDKIKGLNKAETKVNYFKGAKENWRTNISAWQEVSLGEVYKGIELKLRAYGNNVEKFFTVHPKGSINDIKLKIEGAKQLTVNKDGELEVETELGVVKYTKPVAYQEEKIPSPLAAYGSFEPTAHRGEGKGEGALQNKQYIKVA